MFGVTRFTAVISEPQAAILAVGAIQERPTGRDGQVVLAPLMTATLAADHRIIYGADAARFLAQLRDLLQTPMRMLL
jgi:pyruvate dehydrogenase E2 component (dihydrolipoamide acetyltransferase)